MFVNDIPSIVSSPVFMFADDTKIFRVIRNEKDYVTLQIGLNRMIAWPRSRKQKSPLQMVTTLAIEI